MMQRKVKKIASTYSQVQISQYQLPCDEYIIQRFKAESITAGEASIT